MGTTAENGHWVARDFAARQESVRFRYTRVEHVVDFFSGPKRPLSEHVNREPQTRRPIAAMTVNYYRIRLNSSFIWATERRYVNARASPHLARRRRGHGDHQ